MKKIHNSDTSLSITVASIERLKNLQNRSSANNNYVSMWRHFNKFLIRLDYIPQSWEVCTSMFCAYLIKKHGIQSSTLKSYISAIKFTLKNDCYKWKDDEVWLSSLTRSCRTINDRMITRLPIQFKLLELILFEIQRTLGGSQPYLEKLYLAMFALSYYGLLRIGEVTESDHNILAINVHVATNKKKIVLLM